MPGVTQSSYTNALRTVYKDFITRTFTDNRVLRQKMKATKDRTAEGNKISFPLHVGGSGAIKFTSGVDLPIAKAQQIERGEANYKHLYARVQVEGPAIGASSRKYAGEEKALDFEMQRIRKDIAYLDHRALWLGSEAKMGDIVDATSATSFTVDAADTRYFRKGDCIDVLIASTGVVDAGVSGAVISNVARGASSGTITLDSSYPTLNDYASVDTTYDVFWHEGRRDWPWGVLDIVSESDPNAANYGGIARSGKNWWMGKVVTESGSLQLDWIQNVIDIVEEDAGTIEQVAIFCDRTTWNFVASSLVGDRRFGGTQKALEGWANSLNFNGTPLVKDQHCPANQIYVFDFATWTEYQDPDTGQGGWIDEDGAILCRVPGKDAFEAGWKKYTQNICHNPAGQGVLTGFTL